MAGDRPNLITLFKGDDKETFVKRVIKKDGTDEESVLLLSEDIDTLNEGLADLNVGLLKTIQDRLQTVNSPDDNFFIGEVTCDLEVEIEATKSKEHGLILRYKVFQNKTTVKTNIQARLNAKNIQK